MERLENFLAFFGITGLSFSDKKAKIEISSEQLDEGNKAFEKMVTDFDSVSKELTTIKAENHKLASDLEEDRQQMVAKVEKLTNANAKVEEQATEIETLTAEVERLKQTDGAMTTSVTKKTDAQKKSGGPITSNDKSFDENFKAVREAYFPNN